MFQTYFVGDPTFVMPAPQTGSVFIPAQSIQKLVYPSVVFLCLDSKEIAPGLANYQAVELHVIINTSLSERADDYPSLLNLHNDRVDKCLILLGNSALSQGLLNQPAIGLPDPRTVRDFYFYGYGVITDEKHMKEPTRLSDLLSIQTNFRPSDA